MRDTAFADSSRYRPAEIEHHYGPQVHLLHSPLLWLELAQLCAPNMAQPAISRRVRELYRALAREVVAYAWPKTCVTMPTRMAAVTDRGAWTGEVPDPDQRAVVVGIARAGTVPAQTIFEFLCDVLRADAIRQDHLVMARTLGEDGRVTGAAMQSAKTDGAANGALVLLPDPMGATGSTIVTACDHYKQHPQGRPARLIAMHLIVTPEYLARMRQDQPDVQIWALRLDRGMSSPDILATTPGLHPERERGLNERDYIVPGAGGLGELLNNTRH